MLISTFLTANCFLSLNPQTHFYISRATLNFKPEVLSDLSSIFRGRLLLKLCLLPKLSYDVPNSKANQSACFFNEWDDWFQTSSLEWDSRFCSFPCCSRWKGFQSFCLWLPISTLACWFHLRMSLPISLVIDFS